MDKLNCLSSLRLSGLVLAWCLLGMLSPAVAQPSMSDYSALPPLSLLTRGNPMIMLTLSADHQLFFKAYNDYDDLTGDGRPNTTYEKTFNYLGYFDHEKCYVYNATQERFNASGNAPVDTDLQYCASSEWSGNFLNWLTMTRMDLVRYVLYGGYRTVDTPALTVLERAYLPHDAHSFAKYYNGADAAQLMDAGVLDSAASCDPDEAACTGFTFCNTSKPAGVGVFSQAEAARNMPPLLRIVKGDYRFWSNSERFQCLYGPTYSSPGSELANIGTGEEGDNGNDPVITGLNAYATSPAASQGVDLLVRVAVCDGTGDTGSHSCKAYETGSKPIGVLQQYGENLSAPVQFGLITGSYNSNKTYGELRRNIGSMADEINPQTGVFIRDNAIDSIIGNLDALRIVDYLYKDAGGDNNRHGAYNAPNPNNGMSCSWGLNEAFLDGNCRNWGNPFSELLAESYRYFAGASGASGRGDANLLPGLTVATWQDPLANNELKECVDMNVIGFNSSTVSYDGELFSRSLSDLGIPGGGNPTVSSLVKAIGEYEIDPAAKYFIGQSGTLNNGLCTPKAISDLSDARGTCPEAPGLGGGYAAAGLAHHVYTTDIRPDISGRHTVRTFGVTLAGTLPTISVPVPGSNGQEITILPACRNAAKAVNANCAIVDFKPLEITDTSGAYYVSWEDSEQGGDFDVDLNGIIRYTVAADRITVQTRIIYSSTPDPMGFGLVISGTGTAEDNLYIFSGANGYRADEYGCGDGCNEPVWRGREFSINAAGGQNLAAKFLEPPLYYAAKWGSFKNKHLGAEFDPRVPDDPSKWDEDGDGQPDGYFLVRNPSQLKTQMEKTINGILYRVATGTGASMAVSTTSGDGLMLQSLYRGEVSDGTYTVNWVGTMNGLFIDGNGYLREDTDGDRRLTQADRIVEIYYDRDDDETMVNRYDVGPDGEPLINENTRLRMTLEDIRPLWNARDQLGNLSNTELLTQRTPYMGNDRGRYIFTAIDRVEAGGADGLVTGEDVVDFTVNAVNNRADFASLLDVGAADDAARVVRFIRGEEGIEGFRSRSLNLDNDSALEKWLLGDIIHSTAAIVGAPSGRYDLNYSDETYRAFHNQYANRRQVAYVGSNDGMLHAFNAGFFNSAENRYSTTPTGEAGGLPLGDELWGYVPYNLLPHLKWLTQPDYSHVYFVDSQVQSFDVNIFSPDDDHPYGWGTIIVVGMRFGGGDYPVTVADGDHRILRSAYAIFDVTNPEKEPRLLAEITDENLGFTVGQADIVKFRAPSEGGSFAEPDRNDWYLVFGSGPRGPNALHTATSDRGAWLFSLDLQELAQRQEVRLESYELDEPRAFVGGLRSADWNRDYSDDGLYFGITGDGVARDGEKTRGGLKQVILNDDGGTIFGTSNDLVDSRDFDAPITARPVAVNDSLGNYWVFAGSGRFLSAGDLAATGEHYYFGIKVNTADDLRTQPLRAAQLFPASEHQVYMADNGLTLVESDQGEVIGTVDDANSRVAELGGWYREFRPGESTFTVPAFLSGTLVINGYTPPDVISCQATGTTRQYVLDMFNGMAQTRLRSTFLDGSTTTRDDTVYRGVDEVGNVIEGMASDNVALDGRSGTLTEHGKQVYVELKALAPDAHRRSWREIPSDEIDLN